MLLIAAFTRFPKSPDPTSSIRPFELEQGSSQLQATVTMIGGLLAFLLGAAAVGAVSKLQYGLSAHAKYLHGHLTQKATQGMRPALHSDAYLPRAI
jgi:hypothetical protein